MKGLEVRIYYVTMCDEDNTTLSSVSASAEQEKNFRVYCGSQEIRRNRLNVLEEKGTANFL